jgi:N-acetylglucosamine malate deacetylase 2
VVGADTFEYQFALNFKCNVMKRLLLTSMLIMASVIITNAQNNSTRAEKQTKFRILYIYAHPDDESFGPSPVMKQQLQQGHEVYMLTLTRGGATKVRHKLGLTVEEMGEIRFKEMKKVEAFLGLTSMTVMNLVDGGLQEMDPREIEKIVADHIKMIKPQLIVTYPVHGVSGFHDHLVTHAVVKRVFMELKESGASYLKRLAFITLPNKTDQVNIQGSFVIKNSDPMLIDCEVHMTDKDVQVFKQSLSCYETYKEMIEKSGVVGMLGDRMFFEIYKEDHKPVLTDLTAGIEKGPQK